MAACLRLFRFPSPRRPSRRRCGCLPPALDTRPVRFRRHGAFPEPTRQLPGQSEAWEAEAGCIAFQLKVRCRLGQDTPPEAAATGPFAFHGHPDTAVSPLSRVEQLANLAGREAFFPAGRRAFPAADGSGWRLDVQAVQRRSGALFVINPTWMGRPEPSRCLRRRAWRGGSSVSLAGVRWCW